MAVKVVIRPHPKSHPFAERECYVNPHEQVKVGRSVAKVKAATNNFIFDCKVLSRNHAVIWLDDGQFYIRDTKSSNGTFVNSHRLSRTGEESAPVPIRDGDIVQFGVDVTENQNRSVTHGCIITTFHCDLDVKKSGNIAQDPMVDVSARDLDELARILIETKQHQEVLDMKLSSVQGDITETKSETQQAFKSFLDEDELLSRIEMLENQLLFYTQDLSEDCLHKQLTVESEKRHQEVIKAKDNVKRVLQEKLDLSCKLSDTKREREHYQQDAERRTTLYEESQKEMSALAETQRQRLAEMEELRTQLNSMEERHSVLEQKSSEEQTTLNTQLAEVKEEHDRLVEERDRLSGVNAAYEESQAMISGENIELRQEITTLKLQLDATSEVKADQSDKLRLDDLEEQLEAALGKSQALAEQLERANSSREEVHLLAEQRMQRLTTLEREIQEKSDVMSALELRVKQLSETSTHSVTNGLATGAASSSVITATPAGNSSAASSVGSIGSVGRVGSGDSSMDNIKRVASLDDDDFGEGPFMPKSASSPNSRPESVSTARSDLELTSPQVDPSTSLKDMRMSMAMRSNHSTPAQYVTMRQNLSDSRKFISRLQHENKDLTGARKQLLLNLEESESRHSQEQQILRQQLSSAGDSYRHLQVQFESQSVELLDLRRSAADSIVRQRQMEEREKAHASLSSTKAHPSRVVMEKKTLVLYCFGSLVVGFILSYLLACR